MKEILAVIPEQNKPEMKRLLADLGEKIGTEWAKHNTVRKIDSFMLQHWGSELKEAKKNGKNQLVEKIKEIDRKVDEILS